MTDMFKGDDAGLIESINAAIELNRDGAMTPRIPTMAIELLTSAAVRLARATDDASLVKGEDITNVADELRAISADMADEKVSERLWRAVYEQAIAIEAALAARGAAGWRPDREKVARIIDHEGYWERLDSCNHALSTVSMSEDQRRSLTEVRDDELRGTADSLAKADAILAREGGRQSARDRAVLQRLVDASAALVVKAVRAPGDEVGLEDWTAAVTEARALLTPAPPADKPVKMLVDQEWLGRHAETDPDTCVEVRPADQKGGA